jgi:phosphohistidine phosphatase
VTATRRLHLLRHAKSSGDDASLSDAERPLAARGRSATKALRSHFARTGVSVDLVLCSPAVRTRETWQRVADGVAGEPKVRDVWQVYEASAATLLGILRAVDDDVTGVLLVGHNPGIEDLLAELAGVHQRVPTGGFATLDVEGSWSALGPHTATLRGLVRPRDLPG